MRYMICTFIVFLFSCCYHEKKDDVKKNQDKDSTTNNEKLNTKKAREDSLYLIEQKRIKDSINAEYEKERKHRERIIEIREKKIKRNLKKGRIHNRNYYPESIVVGHLEEDTIVGCFDGIDIETLYIKAVPCGCKNSLFCKHAKDYETIKYYLVSKSGKFPKVRIIAADHMPPRIVNEGDLDGNGTCEIGYMYTWVTSNWRVYRILTWHNNQWRYLINPNKEYMASNRDFRLSGYEVAEPGKDSGTVKIHTGFSYPTEGLITKIVKPSFTVIDDIR